MAHVEHIYILRTTAATVSRIYYCCVGLQSFSRIVPMGAPPTYFWLDTGACGILVWDGTNNNIIVEVPALWARLADGVEVRERTRTNAFLRGSKGGRSNGEGQLYRDVISDRLRSPPGFR